MSLLLLHRRIPIARVLQSTGLFSAQSNVFQQRQGPAYSNGGLAKRKEQEGTSEVGLPLGERIKENTKTASYTGVILLGVGLTGGLFYVIFRELFSSNSPQNIYTAALERCVSDPQIQDALGAPIKGFGEENSRRRRRHVAHTIYQTDAGVKLIRMNFYIQGSRNKATVYLEKTTVTVLQSCNKRILC